MITAEPAPGYRLHEGLGRARSVGFIGLGVMGSPMAINIAAKLPNRMQLHVYDINEAAIDHVVSRSGGHVHKSTSAAHLAAESNVVISMVPEGSHVKALYMDQEDSVLRTDLSGKTIIECSTIDVQSSETVRSAVRDSYPTAHFYDAPVSGGSMGAEAGTLTFMVGCEDSDSKAPLLRSLLGLMGTSVFFCGGPTLGLAAKLCNNYCSGLIALATSEAFNIGMKIGIDPRVLASVFAKSTAQSTINDRWNPVPGVCPQAPASKDYAGGFRVELMRKDFALAVEAAKAHNARLILGESGLGAYTEAAEDPSCRGRDSRVVFRLIGGDEKWQG